MAQARSIVVRLASINDFRLCIVIVCRLSVNSLALELVTTDILRRKLQTSTRGGQSCNKFFEKMQSLADQLAATSGPVANTELVRLILSGLGAEFNSFVVTITTREKPVTINNLRVFLFTHESLLTTQSGVTPFSSLPSSQNPTVFFFHSRPKSGPPKNGYNLKPSYGSPRSSYPSGSAPRPNYSPRPNYNPNTPLLSIPPHRSMDFKPLISSPSHIIRIGPRSVSFVQRELIMLAIVGILLITFPNRTSMIFNLTLCTPHSRSFKLLQLNILLFTRALKGTLIRVPLTM